ncbi:hypothetical protein BH24ACT25_BH24ACT25_12570 [soil metagenome]
MDPGQLAGALAVGLAAGVASGVLGIGGGVLFVPGLVIFLELGLLEAEATSLVAVVLVAVVGAWRQRGHGNLRLRDGLVIGALAPLGVLGGVALANALPERALELGFAGVQLYFAYELIRRALRMRREAAGGAAGSSGA